MKRCVISWRCLLLGLFLLANIRIALGETTATFCNPPNIEYHLQAYKPGASLKPAPAGTPCWREAADPACILFKGDYYLFASVSYAYWHSKDMIHWTQVQAPGLPLDYWEPNLFVIGDELYYCHHRDAIYKSADPKNGKWTKVRNRLGGTDTEGGFMVDDDGKVFHVGLRYPGERGFFTRELDPKNNLKDIGGPWPCTNVNEFRLAWDHPESGHPGYYVGTYRREPGEPWLIGGPTGEGAQIMKHNGTYFMQYAHSTGSAFFGYRDYVFTSDSPRGPWHFQRHNPASYDPTGFCKGAGNSCVFKDAGGEFWRVTTVNAEKVWLWERRLGIYPAGFDRDNTMYTDTYLGELPQYGAGKNPHPEKRNELGGNLTGWMLLSCNKPVMASSTLDAEHAPGLALDEEMTTWWSAKTGAGEWLAVDLQKPCELRAVQVNFAEQDIFSPVSAGPLFHQYTLEVSDDGSNWRMLVDKSHNQRDVPHDYTELETAVTARHVRLNIQHMPAGGRAAVRGLRIFGNSADPLPEPVRVFHAERLKDAPYDDRFAKVSWEPVKDAEGYVVRYGTAPDKLYLAVDVRNASELPVEIPLWKPYQLKSPWKKNSFLGLTGGIDYYFAIDSFNARVITHGTTVYRAPATPRDDEVASTKSVKKRETIKDEALVPPYTLPDPLVCQDGSCVGDPLNWRAKRRPELLKLFADEVYGKTRLGRPESLKFVLRDEKKDARGGKATRLRVGVLFEGREDGRQMELLIYLPNQVKGPVPLFYGLNFDGNYTVTDDADLPVPKHFVNGLFENKAKNNRAAESGRGIHQSRWQCDYLLEHGYGLATACYCEIEPDAEGHEKEGPRGLVPDRGPEDWGMIGAWAWGLSRGMDYLETNPRIDAKRIALTGFSRLGKVALWAGAQDERFALVVSNESGAGGAALSKRIFGETVADLVRRGWFGGNFANYAGREQEMPVDQHELLALMAPRPLLITSAQGDLWSDPRGEFLAAVAADPVYRLLETEGLTQKEWPEPGKLAGTTLGYFLRTGKHDVTVEDWQQMVVFADKHLKKNP